MLEGKERPQDSGDSSLIKLAWCISMMWRLRLLRCVQRLPHTWHLKEGSLPHSRRWCLLKCSFLQYDRSHLSQENLRSHGITSSIKPITYQSYSLFILKLNQYCFRLCWVGTWKVSHLSYVLKYSLNSVWSITLIILDNISKLLWIIK